MREGQNEIFGEGVDEAEGNLVVMVVAVYGILRHVVQHVVHPAHIPLQTEAEPSEINGARHLRPGGGFFCNHHRIGVGAVDVFVQRAQEMNRVEVFFSAETIGYPLAFAAAVIEI